MWQWIARLVVEERAQDIVEYVLLCATISLVVLAGINSFGGQMEAIYTALATTVNGLL